MHRNLLSTIDELIAEDNWEVGLACEGCGCAEFRILRRFGEVRIECADCEAEIEIADAYGM